MQLRSLRFFPHWDKQSAVQVTGFLKLVNHVLSRRSPLYNWLEIGSFVGESATLLMGFPQIKTVHIVERSPQFCKILAKKFNNRVKNKSCIIHNNLSERKLPQFEKNSFDCVYIDGNHSYANVLRDIKMSHRIVNAGGFLCGHDYQKPWQGVIDAVHFFIENSNYTVKDLVLFEDSSWLLHRD